MPFEHVEVSRDGPITVITINRPEAHNALNAASHRALETVFDDFAADKEQWIAIITGAGDKAFCAGHDLKQQVAGEGLVLPPTGFAGLTARYDLTKPVIAAVNGVALGGGFEIALASDLIVASSNAVFALPEARVGLAAVGGGIQRLPRSIGLHRAMEVLLTGRRINAARGYELGFVNEVVEGDVVTAAIRWASEILECSPMSIRATKQSAQRSLSVSVEEGTASQWAFDAMQEMFSSQDCVEGPRAFAEKRRPQWVGR